MTIAARDLIAHVARLRGLRPADLQKQPRGMEMHDGKRARSEAMALIRSELGYSNQMIGRLFGGFHHTSVMAAIARAHRRGELDRIRESFQRAPDSVDSLLASLRVRREELVARYERELLAIDREMDIVRHTARLMMRMGASSLIDDTQKADAA